MRIDASCIERIEKALAEVSNMRAAEVHFVSERANVEKDGAHDAIELAVTIERTAGAHTTQPSNSIGIARSGRRGVLRSEVEEEAMAAGQRRGT